MERAGEKLKRVRERLKLTYRDVERASQEIAARRKSDEFAVALSRLADIENKGTLPTVYRLYTLCAIYRLEFDEVLRWYGVPVDELATEALQIGLDETHLVQFEPQGQATVPETADREIDLNHTTLLSHLILRWGRMPLRFLNGLNLRQHRYGFIGMEDWSMYPILQPGSLVMIDETKRKIAAGGWSSEFDRPIYFFEHRDGYLCGWGALTHGLLLVQPHPASQSAPHVFQFPAEIEVIGQVAGAAMLLDSRKRRLRGPAHPKSVNP